MPKPPEPLPPPPSLTPIQVYVALFGREPSSVEVLAFIAAWNKMAEVAGIFLFTDKFSPDGSLRLQGFTVDREGKLTPPAQRDPNNPQPFTFTPEQHEIYQNTFRPLFAQAYVKALPEQPGVSHDQAWNVYRQHLRDLGVWNVKNKDWTAALAERFEVMWGEYKAKVDTKEWKAYRDAKEWYTDLLSDQAGYFPAVTPETEKEFMKKFEEEQVYLEEFDKAFERFMAFDTRIPNELLASTKALLEKQHGRAAWRGTAGTAIDFITANVDEAIRQATADQYLAEDFDHAYARMKAEGKIEDLPANVETELMADLRQQWVNSGLRKEKVGAETIIKSGFAKAKLGAEARVRETEDFDYAYERAIARGEIERPAKNIERAVKADLWEQVRNLRLRGVTTEAEYVVRGGWRQAVATATQHQYDEENFNTAYERLIAIGQIERPSEEQEDWVKADLAQQVQTARLRGQTTPAETIIKSGLTQTLGRAQAKVLETEDFDRAYERLIAVDKIPGYADKTFAKRVKSQVREKWARRILRGEKVSAESVILGPTGTIATAEKEETTRKTEAEKATKEAEEQRLAQQWETTLSGLVEASDYEKASRMMGSPVGSLGEDLKTVRVISEAAPYRAILDQQIASLTPETPEGMSPDDYYKNRVQRYEQLLRETPEPEDQVWLRQEWEPVLANLARSRDLGFHTFIQQQFGPGEQDPGFKRLRQGFQYAQGAGRGPNLAAVPGFADFVGREFEKLRPQYEIQREAEQAGVGSSDVALRRRQALAEERRQSRSFQTSILTRRR